MIYHRDQLLSIISLNLKRTNRIFDQTFHPVHGILLTVEAYDIGHGVYLSLT